MRRRAVIRAHLFLEKLQPRKIAVLRALYLGDMLCAVPALRGLRTAAPTAEVTLIGLPWADEFGARFRRYVDRVIHLPGYRGFPEQPFDAAAFAEMVRGCVAEGFDLAFQMQGDGTHSNRLIAELGAARTAGFYPMGGTPPDRENYIPYPNGLPETNRLLALTSHLGAPGSSELEFPLAGEDFAEMRGILPMGIVPYVVVHPGGRSPARRWEPEAFAQVADSLARRGYSVVTTGSDVDGEVAWRVAERMLAPALNIAGSTTLGALGAVVSRSSLVITNDTGVSHLAVATATPSVIIGRNSDPVRWAPSDRVRHRYRADSSAQPVLPDDVLAEAIDLLSECTEAAEVAV